jgi:hypothetical protein
MTVFQWFVTFLGWIRAFYRRQSRPLYTAGQIAKITGLETQTIRDLTQRGSLRRHRVGPSQVPHYDLDEVRADIRRRG